jgi:hypothetical protein
VLYAPQTRAPFSRRVLVIVIWADLSWQLFSRGTVLRLYVERLIHILDRE